MKISQLIQSLSEAEPATSALLGPDGKPIGSSVTSVGGGARTPGQAAAIQQAASGQPQAHNPFGLKVVPGGKDQQATTPSNQASSAEIPAVATPAVQPTTQATPKTDKLAKAASIGGKARDIAGGFIRGVGNIGAELGQAAGQIAASPFAGAVRGYQTARQGGSFTSPTSGAKLSGYAGGSGSAQQTSTSQDDVADLKQMIARIDQRLTAAGVKENSKPK